jgi:hypothetical protein
MSQEAVELFIGRIITDEKFRKQAIKSVDQACSTIGLKVSAQEISYLRLLDFTLFGEVALTIDGAIRRG